MKYLISMLIVICTLVSGCSHGPSAADKKVTDFKGRCVNAQIGGQNYAAECLGILVQVDTRNYSSLGFSLTNGRKVIFLAGRDPAFHSSPWSSLATQAAMVTETDTHNYKPVAVVCDQGRDVPPTRITCTGQADGDGVFFDFLIEQQ